MEFGVEGMVHPTIRETMKVEAYIGFLSCEVTEFAVESEIDVSFMYKMNMPLKP